MHEGCEVDSVYEDRLMAPIREKQLENEMDDENFFTIVEEHEVR